MSMAIDTHSTTYWGRNRDDRLPFTSGWREAAAPAPGGEGKPVTTGSVEPAAAAKPAKAAENDEGLGFDDLLDIINPLQHLPVVSTIYREVTGDEISTPARIIGGGIFGGVVGLLGSAIDSAVDDITGKDIGEHMMAMVFGDDEDDIAPDVPPTAVADNAPEAESGEDRPAQAAQADAADPAASDDVVAAAAATAAPILPAAPKAESRTLANEETPAAEAKSAMLPAGLAPVVPSAAPQMSPAAFDLLMKHFGEDQKTALMASLDAEGNLTGKKDGEKAGAVN